MTNRPTYKVAQQHVLSELIQAHRLLADYVEQFGGDADGASYDAIGVQIKNLRNLWKEEDSINVVCPYCGTVIYGTVKDIDSGLRKHLDYCDCDTYLNTDEDNL